MGGGPQERGPPWPLRLCLRVSDMKDLVFSLSPFFLAQEVSNFRGSLQQVVVSPTLDTAVSGHGAGVATSRRDRCHATATAQTIYLSRRVL